MNRWRVIHLVLLGFIAEASPAPAADRYLAEWCDGTRSSAAEVADWSWVDKQPRLGERPLYDLGSRVRWLRDTTIEAPPPPAAEVEFVGGDCLPGKVVAYRAATQLPGNPVAAHLEVEPAANVDRPGTPPRLHVRITTDWVRRVIWERRPHDRYSPSTVFCRDGRQLQFRSLRWQEASVRLLLEDGQTQLLFEEIAELHLPAVDPWDALFGQRAMLDPSAKSLFMTIESMHGLRATTSLERFEARSIGKEGDPNNWVHLVQPAWSLDGFYVSHRQIRQRTFFAPHEVPLTAIAATRGVHRAALTSGWKHARWQQGIHGGPLTGGDEPYGWGIGVHAHHELEFDLPPAARTFRTRMALDASAGAGGCVKAVIYNGSTESEPLFESRPLIGSRTVLDTGRMALAPVIKDHARLVLVADAMLEDSPAGADPLDVRDAFNWLEPLVELNPDDAYSAITSRWERVLPALSQWQTSGEYLDGWQIEHVLYPGGFSPVIEVDGDRWSVKRRLLVEGVAPRLVVRATHPDRRNKPGRLRVLIDGKQLLDSAIAVATDPASQVPTTVALDDFIGREVDAEVQFEFTGPAATLDWRGAAVVEESGN